MEDIDIRLVLLTSTCPNCHHSNVESFEDADDSMQFDCPDCGWTGNATEEQILRLVAITSQFPEV